VSVFEVVAQPLRRRILDLLRERPHLVGELVAELGLSQPAVSKHLRVLRQVGLVRVRVDAQRRWYELRPELLSEIDSWLAPYRVLWPGRLNALERHLDQVAGTSAHTQHRRMSSPVNATLSTDDGRQVLRFEKKLAHPPEKVWSAITEPAQLSRWYPMKVTEMDLQVGGKVTIDDGEGNIYSGRITELEPQRVFAYLEEETDLLHMELRPEGAETVLIFTHTFDTAFMVAPTAGGWHTTLDALEDVLAGRPVDETDRTIELHEKYVREFGLDQGTAESTSDGWRVRFDRPLMSQPVDKVWAALTEGGTPEVGDTVPAPFTTEQVPAGKVDEVEAPRRLEYHWTSDGRGVGRVSWELADGAGARIVLTQTGPAELAEQRETALKAWHQHIEALAARLYESTD